MAHLTWMNLFMVLKKENKIKITGIEEDDN